MSAQIPKKAKPKAPEQSEALTVIVLITLALAVIGYFVFFSEDTSFILKAKFTQADGLKAGAEVQCAGVKVGRVKEINFLDIPKNDQTKNIFELVLELSPTIRGVPIEKIIHKDGSAVIIVIGALGDRGVDIVPGTAGAPPISRGDYLSGKIELTPAMVSSDLQALKNKFTGLQAILEENSKWINEGNGNLGKYNKKDNEAAINLRNLITTTDSIQPLLYADKGSIGKFRKDTKIEASVNKLYKLADELQELLEKGNGTAGRFMQDETMEKRVKDIQERSISLVDRFEKIAERAQKGNGSVAQFINDTKLKNDIKELENNFNKLSTKISGKKGTIHLAMTDPRLSENISAISIELAKLAYDIRQKPTKYVKFTLF